MALLRVIAQVALISGARHLSGKEAATGGILTDRALEEVVVRKTMKSLFDSGRIAARQQVRRVQTGMLADNFIALALQLSSHP